MPVGPLVSSPTAPQYEHTKCVDARPSQEPRDPSKTCLAPPQALLRLFPTPNAFTKTRPRLPEDLPTLLPKACVGFPDHHLFLHALPVAILLSLPVKIPSPSLWLMAGPFQSPSCAHANTVLQHSGRTGSAEWAEPFEHILWFGYMAPTIHGSCGFSNPFGNRC